MLKCDLTEVKLQIIYRAYDKTGNTTRRSSKVDKDKDESLEDALVRSNLVYCPINKWHNKHEPITRRKVHATSRYAHCTQPG